MFHRERKSLDRTIDRLSLSLYAVRSEENTSVFLSLILYSCISDPLNGPVGNLRYSHILFGTGNWSATEECCHWCV